MADKIDIEGSTDNVLTESGTDAILQETIPAGAGVDSNAMSMRFGRMTINMRYARSACYEL